MKDGVTRIGNERFERYRGACTVERRDIKRDKLGDKICSKYFGEFVLLLHSGGLKLCLRMKFFS